MRGRSRVGPAEDRACPPEVLGPRPRDRQRAADPRQQVLALDGGAVARCLEDVQRLGQAARCASSPGTYRGKLQPDTGADPVRPQFDRDRDLRKAADNLEIGLHQDLRITRPAECGEHPPHRGRPGLHVHSAGPAPAARPSGRPGTRGGSDSRRVAIDRSPSASSWRRPVSAWVAAATVPPSGRSRPGRRTLRHLAAGAAVEPSQNRSTAPRRHPIVACGGQQPTHRSGWGQRRRAPGTPDPPGDVHGEIDLRLAGPPSGRSNAATVQGGNRRAASSTRSSAGAGTSEAGARRRRRRRSRRLTPPPAGPRLRVRPDPASARAISPAPGGRVRARSRRNSPRRAGQCSR